MSDAPQIGQFGPADLDHILRTFSNYDNIMNRLRLDAIREHFLGVESVYLKELHEKKSALIAAVKRGEDVKRSLRVCSAIIGIYDATLNIVKADFPVK